MNVPHAFFRRATLRLAPLFIVLLVTLLFSLAPSRAFAATTRSWGDGTATWSTGSDWVGAGVPGAGDTINIALGGSSRTITYDYTGVAVTLLSLNMSYSGGTVNDSNTLFMPGNNLTATNENIGGYPGFPATNGSAVFTQTGGINTTALTMGYNSADRGFYNLSGTGMLVATNSETIGSSGTGTFTQTGGTNNAGSQGIIVGYLSNSNGTYILSGTGSLVSSLYDNIGYQGTGVFLQSGGTYVNGGVLILGNTSLGTGTYTLSGGTATVGAVYVGWTSTGGTGILNVNTAGVLTISGGNGLEAFANNANCAVNLSAGGTISTTGLNFNGVPSLFHWTGGTLNINSGVGVTFDSAAPANSTASAFGAALTLGANQTFVIDDEILGGVGAFSLTLNSGSSHVVSINLIIAPTGTLTQNAGSTLYAPELIQQGGTVNGTLQNQGQFSYYSGLFNGRLLNQGTILLDVPTFIAGNGIENDATIMLRAGQTITVNGAGLDNYGAVTLSGGVISGSGPAINDFGGTFQAHGTINAVFTNFGRVTVDGTLHFGSGASNSGIFGGAGTVFGAFANGSGGVVDVTADSVLGFITPWTNAGLINLQASTALLGGGTVTNTGTIQGIGTINASIANSTGTLRPAGGELDLGGPANSNGALGQIQLSTGNSLLCLTGLSTNAGLIALSGGTFDNNNFALNNTGTIAGFGILRTGGLTNNNIVQFASGNAQVYGSVTSGVGSRITVVEGATATFFGSVALNNTTFQVAPGATAIFFGAVSGNSNLGGGGIVDFESGHSPLSVGILSQVAVQVQSPASVDLPSLQAASLYLAGSVHVALNGSNSGLSILGSLTNGGGTFDLANNDLLLRNTSVTSVRALVQSAYAGGAWTGPGITASAAAANPGQGLGILSGSDYLLLNPGAAFDGVTVLPSDALVKYTYQGDATLDGRISMDDYLQIDGAFARHLAAPAWVNGDFNYDGTVNFLDYALIDFAYQHQSGGVLAASMIQLHSAIFGQPYDAAFSALEIAAVPEPGTLCMLILGGSVCLIRRRWTAVPPGIRSGVS